MSMLSWEQLLPDWSFRDSRLRSRALILLNALVAAPGPSFSAVFGKQKTAIKAAYEFCQNRAMDLLTLLAPTFITTGGLVHDLGSTVLVLQDTTELELSSQKAMTGIGEIGNPKCRGIFLHAGLAVTTDGVPIGLLSTLTWVRDPEEHGKAALRRERPFDEKESAKWWNTIDAAERVVKHPGRLVHVGDREGDIFDVFGRCSAMGYRALFRARIDRQVLDAPQTRLWAEAENWRVAGQRVVDIPYRSARHGQPARAARTAVLDLHYGSVTIAQPKSGSGLIQLSVVLARENDPADETDAIEWLLLTTDVLNTVEDAWTRVDWYRRRWLIEEFHKCLKSLCRVEKRQFKDRHPFEVNLALMMLVSVRLLFMRNIARAEPDAPAATVLSEEEEHVLRAYHDQGARKPLPSFLTVSQAIRLVAILGGFMARKGDGEPGFESLGKGYSKLATLIVGYRLARGLSAGADPALASLDPARPAYFRRASGRPTTSR
jgi:hypothetical protein